jgi:hypothetical protein
MNGSRPILLSDLPKRRLEHTVKQLHNDSQQKIDLVRRCVGEVGKNIEEADAANGIYILRHWYLLETEVVIQEIPLTAEQIVSMYLGLLTQGSRKARALIRAADHDQEDEEGDDDRDPGDDKGGHADDPPADDPPGDARPAPTGPAAAAQVVGERREAEAGVNNSTGNPAPKPQEGDGA